MRVAVARENADARRRVPPSEPDGSGIGVNYVDAYVKALEVELASGAKVSCKRKGLEITLSIGERSGTALLRRLDHGPDVETILRRALEDAAEAAGSRFTVEDGTMYLEVE